jgi:UDP-N-acetylglucosamine 2-epimerase
MKIFSIVGARPQFIKLAPLSSSLSHHHEEYIVHTGQHYDYAMSEKIFIDLGIRKLDIHLEIGRGSQTSQIAEMVLKLEKQMLEKKPDLIVVFGDTNSTLAGSITASKLNIPILHIEAGLRSYNKSMPEEINRIVTDHISKYLFAPTQTAFDILKNEGLGKETFLTGDIMVDTMKNNIAIAIQKSTIIADLKLQNKVYSLLTLHRNYNVDDASMLELILNELAQLDDHIIFPVHPRTRKMLDKSYQMPDNIEMIEPQGYLDFITLEQFSKRILTDSGGIQKEAYILRKPCVTLRSETEWVETVTAKWNLLINPIEKFFAEKIANFNTPTEQENIFGVDVTKKMIDIINNIN